jgi:hypothetical protein
MTPPTLTVVEGGATNSRPTPESWNRHGIDTVRYRYRADPNAYAKFAHTGASSEGLRGELYRQADGVRLGAHRDGMLYAEGRLAAILNGPDDHSLLPMAALEAGSHAAAERFAFDVDASDARLGRLDIAAELSFDDGRDGLAFLHALSLADVPWAKVGTEGKKRDEIQTVNFRSGRGRQILMRAYDKGIEAGIARSGELIRFERQRRYRKDAERTVAMTLGLDAGELFVGRELRSLVDVTAETVCDTWGAIDRLNELMWQGRITPPKADALAGFVARGGEGHRSSTWYGRWADLRALGIIVDPLARERSHVPVGRHLREMLEAVAA